MNPVSTPIQAHDITPETLLQEAMELKQGGYRLVTLTCLHHGPEHEVIYHFDRQYELVHLRARIPVGESLPSLSGILPGALIVENEIKDHFGVVFTGLLIDFGGRLMLTEDAPRTPMNKRCGMDIDAREAGAVSLPKTGSEEES